MKESFCKNVANDPACHHCGRSLAKEIPFRTNYKNGKWGWWCPACCRVTYTEDK